MKVNQIITALLKAAPIHELFNLRSRLIADFEEQALGQILSQRTMETTREIDREIERRLAAKPYFWVRYDEGTCGHKHYEITGAVECLGRRDTVKTDAEIIKLTTEGALRYREGYLRPVERRDEMDLMAEHGETRDAIAETVDADKNLADAIIVTALDLDMAARSDIAARICHSVAAEVYQTQRMLDVAMKNVERVDA